MVTTQKPQTAIYNTRTPDRKSQAMSTFLIHYSAGHSMSYSAGKAGVHRKTIWAWRKADSEFDKAVQDAHDGGTDWYEDTLYELAMEGVVAAIIFALKMRGRYRPIGRAANNNSEDTDDGCDVTVEELAEKALNMGYVALPGR